MNITWERFAIVGVVVAEHVEPVDQLVTDRLLRRNGDMWRHVMGMSSCSPVPDSRSKPILSLDTTCQENT